MLNFFKGCESKLKLRSRTLLVADWVSSGIILSEVTFRESPPKVVRSHYEPWPSGLDPFAEPEKTGVLLKELCQSHKFDVESVAVSLPRRDLSLRLLEFPNVSVDDLGALVELQVESRFQTAEHSVGWDWIPHRATPADSRCYVVLCTVPRRICDAVSRSAGKAGWSAFMLTSGDLLSGNLAVPSSEIWSLCVQANRAKIEVTLCRNGIPAAAAAVALPPVRKDSPDAAVAESVISVSNRLIAAVPQHWQAEIGQPSVTVLGSAGQNVARELRVRGTSASFQCSDDRTPRALSIANALQGAVSHETRTSLFRSSLSSAVRRLAQFCFRKKVRNATMTPESVTRGRWPAARIDFLRPHSAELRTAARRKRLAGVVVACGLVSGFVLTGLWLYQNSQQKHLAQLKTERQALQTFVDRGKQITEKWSAVKHWQNASIQGAEEIRRIAELMPPGDRLMVTRLQFENVVDSERSSIRLDGLAADSEDVMVLNKAILSQSGKYDLQPQGIEPSPEGSDFPLQFRIEIRFHVGEEKDEGESL